MVSPTASAPEVPPSMAIKIFSAGVGACVADVITFPLDTAKVRLQVERETTGRGSISGQGDLIPALVYPSFLG